MPIRRFRQSTSLEDAIEQTRGQKNHISKAKYNNKFRSIGICIRCRVNPISTISKWRCDTCLDQMRDSLARWRRDTGRLKNPHAVRKCRERRPQVEGGTFGKQDIVPIDVFFEERRIAFANKLVSIETDFRARKFKDWDTMQDPLKGLGLQVMQVEVRSFGGPIWDRLYASPVHTEGVRE